MDWFEKITGFAELPYEVTQRRLSVEDGRLLSQHTDTTWAVGSLEAPSLGELRLRITRPAIANAALNAPIDVAGLS